MVRSRRRSFRGGTTRPKRDVTWGFYNNSQRLETATDFVIADWIAFPAIVGPTVAGTLPVDSTLIRMIVQAMFSGPIPDVDVGGAWMGLISWQWPSDTIPDAVPLPQFGDFDWMWRWPIPRVGLGGGTALGSITSENTFINSRAMRKMGSDRGLLFVMNGNIDVSEDFGWFLDVRYAYKLPW